LREGVHTIQENAEALLVGSEETGLEVNADKTNYMVICRDQNAGRNHNIKIYNCSFGKVGQLNLFGENLNDVDSVQEEIKTRLKSGNAC